MNLTLDLFSIVTTNFDAMVAFYRDTIGLDVELTMDEYVEFKHNGVRFALTKSSVMHRFTKHGSFADKKSGQSFELAFKVDSPADVNPAYEALLKKGATAVTPPADMPWGQRAAFFADPDGNIHEVFADISSTI